MLEQAPIAAASCLGLYGLCVQISPLHCCNLCCPAWTSMFKACNSLPTCSFGGSVVAGSRMHATSVCHAVGSIVAGGAANRSGRCHRG